MNSSRVRRIVFIGAECTGKTTLTRAVAAQFQEPWSSEYVRAYVNTVQRALCADDLESIARGQIAAEDEAYTAANRWVFHDTNLLSSMLYAEHYFHTQIPWVDATFKERDYHQYFLCEPDFPWQADPGQRESPEERMRLQGCFETMLQRHDLSFKRVSGSLEQRLAQAIQCLQS